MAYGDRIDLAASTISGWFSDQAFDNIFPLTTLLAWMGGVVPEALQLPGLERANRIKTQTGGSNITVPFEYSKTTSVRMASPADTFDTTVQATMRKGTLEWKHCYGSVTLLDVDEDINSGAQAMVNLVNQNKQNIARTFADVLNTQLITGDGTGTNVDGLPCFIASDQTYAGLAQGTYTWLAPAAAALDSGTTVLTLGTMGAVYTACSVQNREPRLILTTDAIYEFYQELLTINQRFTVPTRAVAGFRFVEFRGAFVARDPAVPANYMYYLTPETLNLVVNGNEGNGGLRGYPPRVPDNQFARIIPQRWMGNLICTAPRENGKMSAITSGS